MNDKNLCALCTREAMKVVGNCPVRCRNIFLQFMFDKNVTKETTIVLDNSELPVRVHSADERFSGPGREPTVTYCLSINYAMDVTFHVGWDVKEAEISPNGNWFRNGDYPSGRKRWMLPVLFRITGNAYVGHVSVESDDDPEVYLRY